MALRRTMLLLAALTLGIGAAACGDDGTEGATTAPVATTAMSGTTTATIATTLAPPTSTEAPTTSGAPTTATEPASTSSTTAAPAPFTLQAAGFDDGGDIPVASTCRGANLVPELTFTGIPAGTAVLALTVLDPDADDFIHWVAWNIPADAPGFAGDIPADPELRDGTRQAVNDFASFTEPGAMGPGGAPFRTIGYDGPCPPSEHSYVFTLYALGEQVDLQGGAAGAEALAAIAAVPVIDEVAVTGRFDPAG